MKNIEIFEREGILAHVRGLEDHLTRRMEELRALPIVEMTAATASRRLRPR